MNIKFKNKPYLIGEIGLITTVHTLTPKLMDLAKECNFDCVKFQKTLIYV